MTETATAYRADAIYDQLAQRNAELEHDKSRLLDEIERLQKDNDNLRREVAGWRGA